MAVYLTLPPRGLFRFPPDPLPHALAPPVGDGTLRTPFTITPQIYNAVFHPALPFGFATTYVLLVLWVNGYNKEKGNKPWWIARQRLFSYFVVVHNFLLAVYSAVTFLAMLRAFLVTLPDFTGSNPAMVADSLCKLHGPRGLGDAVTHNITLNIWEAKNQLLKLTPDGTPDPTDLGRLWNEGLGFWGWFFYISKFYEVVDTFIIVAKGKRCQTLQMYHHAGVMLCMWAGMRYASPPIWMFVFVNSLIHAIMYTYYLLSSVQIKVPEYAKRALTSLQIAQFLWGSLYAGSHLFIAYDIPVSTPYTVAARVAAVASSASSAYSSVSSVVSSVIESPTVSGSLGLLIKKLLLRAAGEEGAAERLGYPAVTGKPVAEAIESKLEEVRERVFHQPQYETRWTTESMRINCIDTSGEAFAILLNLCYLAPLTVLFVRFFVRSYLSRGKNPSTVKEAVKDIKDDAEVAAAETESAIEKAGKRAEDVVRDGSAELKKDVKSLHDQLREDVRKLKKGEYKAPQLNEKIEKFDKQVNDLVAKAKQQLQQSTESTHDDGESEEEHEDKENQSPGQSSQTPEKKKKRKHKKKHGSSSTSTPGNVPAADESEAKQDANLAATEPTRPGATDADDSDAMGKSGVGVDLSKSVAQQ